MSASRLIRFAVLLLVATLVAGCGSKGGGSSSANVRFVNMLVDGGAINVTVGSNNTQVVSGLPFDATDCAQPMLYALGRKREIDTFVVYTDSETWCGQVHPVQALRRYRERTGIAARLVVIGMVANGFTIADPEDPGMLDIVGFDTATPEVVSGFARGVV